MTAEQILERLCEKFPLNEIKFKPQAIKNNQALAIAYIDGRVVMDRLDDVLGVLNWEDSYEVINDKGSVKCRLRIRVDNQWVEKEDVGSPSEQPDAGDQMKAGFSDALKRAAVKFGIGRYLYRLPKVWADYDSQKRAFVRPPSLPEWAIPKTPDPKTMAEFEHRLSAFDSAMVKAKYAKPGEPTSFVMNELAKLGHKPPLKDMKTDAIQPAMAAVAAFKKKATAPKEDVYKQYGKLAGLFRLADEVFGALTSPDFDAWLTDEGIPTRKVLEIVAEDTLAGLMDRLGKKLVDKQNGQDDGGGAHY